MSGPPRRDTLSRDDLPLSQGEHLLSTCGIESSCAWVTQEGCFTVAEGYAPDDEGEVVWEVGGSDEDAEAAVSFRTEVRTEFTQSSDGVVCICVA